MKHISSRDLCLCPEVINLIKSVMLQTACLKRAEYYKGNKKKNNSSQLSIFLCSPLISFFSDGVRHTLIPLFFALRIPYTAVICERWLVELVVRLVFSEARGAIGSAL